MLGAAEADFVDSLPEAPVDSDMLHHLARRMAAMPAAPAPAAKALGDVELPRALWDAEIAPRRWVRPGFWVAHLPAWRDDDWHVYLLRAPAGQKLPAHGHAGPELLCVLKGACVDGRRRQAGDFVENPTGSHHHLAVTSDGPCACLIATKGALVWRGAARLLGPAYSV